MASLSAARHCAGISGTLRVIDGIDLDVEDGEFVVFVGPSGCGKSTLLRMIAGLDRPTSGEIAHQRPAGERAQCGGARPRHGVSVLRPVPAHDGAAERNCPFGLENQRMKRDEIDRAASARRARMPAESRKHLSRPQARPAFRRPAPARRHRPRHHAQAEHFPLRRAAVESRC